MPSERPNEWESDFLSKGPSEDDSVEGAVPSEVPESSPSQLIQRTDEEFLDIPEMECEEALYDLSADRQMPEIKRPYPLCIDVFFYPFNKAGQLTLAIIIGGPLAMVGLCFFGYLLMAAMPFLIFISVPMIMASIVVIIGMLLYYNWYLCECLRESSLGGVRAPETMNSTPGIMDLFGQVFHVLCTLLLFVSTYLSTVNSFSLSRTGQWFLLAGLLYFLPMVILGVVTLESFRGLNPLVFLRNIAKTFLPYCFVAGVLVGLRLAIAWLISIMPVTDEPIRWGIRVFHIVWIISEAYLLLVSVHIIGWFAWVCQDRLEW